MGASHTPGPWIDCDNGNIAVTNDYVIAYAYRNGKPKVRDANARLIAESPNLLAELKSLRLAYVNLLENGRDRILFLGGQCDSVAEMEANDRNLRSAVAAIEKAEGSTA